MTIEQPTFEVAQRIGYEVVTHARNREPFLLCGVYYTPSDDPDPEPVAVRTDDKHIDSQLILLRAYMNWVNMGTIRMKARTFDNSIIGMEECLDELKKIRAEILADGD